jgi:hypothetical protein
MPNFRQLYSESDRKRALADQLAQQATIPVQRPQGRQAANTGMFDGLTQLGQALASRRATKQSNALGAQAEEERRKAQVAALSGMANPPNMVERPETQNPYARSQAAIEAGVDPNVVGEYMLSQRPVEASGADNASLAGYRQAKSEGYPGTYTDYKKEFEGREANLPSAWQEWELVSKLTPEQRQQYLEIKRNVPIETINQVRTRVLPGGQTQPLSTLESESDAKQEISRAAATGTESVTPVERVLDAQAKEPRIEAAQRRLQRVAEASKSLGTAGGPIEGRLHGFLGTSVAQEMEAANAQLINELTALTRTPGVGSQSDLEQRLASLALPDITQHPEVRERSIKELDAFIRDLESAIRKVGGAATSDDPELEALLSKYAGP